MAIFFVLSAHQYPTSMVLTMYLVGYCQPQGRISATCATSVWRKEIKPHIYVISNISVCKLSTYVAARPAIWLVWNYSISITQMMPWTNQPITCLLKPLMHSFEPPVFYNTVTYWVFSKLFKCRFILLNSFTSQSSFSERDSLIMQSLSWHSKP